MIESVNLMSWSALLTTCVSIHQPPPLNVLHVEELVYPLREVFLGEPTDPDDDEDDHDGDETEPERLLKHPLAQGLERDVLHGAVATGAWNNVLGHGFIGM